MRCQSRYLPRSACGKRKLRFDLPTLEWEAGLKTVNFREIRPYLPRRLRKQKKVNRVSLNHLSRRSEVDRKIMVKMTWLQHQLFHLFFKEKSLYEIRRDLRCGLRLAEDQKVLWVILFGQMDQQQVRVFLTFLICDYEALRGTLVRQGFRVPIEPEY